MNASMDAELVVPSVSSDSWKQRLLTSEWLGRKVINIGAVSGIEAFALSVYAVLLVHKI